MVSGGPFCKLDDFPGSPASLARRLYANVIPNSTCPVDFECFLRLKDRKDFARRAGLGPQVQSSCWMADSSFSDDRYERNDNSEDNMDDATRFHLILRPRR